MRFLVAILTSSKPALARLCYDSVAGQQRHSWNVDVVVVVNSTNPKHKDAVALALEGASVRIVETLSNGWPGKGHNSLLDIFRDSLEYDYLIPIDGDDVLYPTAFHQLDRFIALSPHCVAIQANDSLQKNPVLSRHVALRDSWNLKSWLDDQENWWLKYRLPNPFVAPLSACTTPARPVLLHRSVLAHLPSKPYAEDMFFDDMLFFMHICEAWAQRPTFNLLFTSNTYIYVHNDMNIDNMAHTSIDYNRDRRLFEVACSNRFSSIRRWDLASLPHHTVDNPTWFRTKDKVVFANTVTERIDNIE